MLDSKTIVSFIKSHKTKIFIILITVTVTGLTYNMINLKNFNKSLESFVSDQILNNVKYYNSYSLNGDYNEFLTLELQNEFDDLTIKEKYILLKNIYVSYNTERSIIAHEHKLLDNIIDKQAFTKIFINTVDDPNNKYEFSFMNFKDKHGISYSESQIYGNNTKSDAYVSSYLADDEKAFAWTAALDVVERNLKAPSTAKFPFSYLNEDIRRIDSSTYIVNSYVDAENSFGAKIRSNFTVTIKKTGENKYIVENLKIY